MTAKDALEAIEQYGWDSERGRDARRVLSSIITSRQLALKKLIRNARAARMAKPSRRRKGRR
jgi:hypothetical protein